LKAFIIFNGPKLPEESFIDPKLKQDSLERWAKLNEKIARILNP